MMNKKTSFFSLGMLACILWINSAMAAPIAPKAPVTKLGKYGVVRATGPCPDEKAVGVPAYPGSVCLKSAAFNADNAFVDLMSADNASKVSDWYAKHLHGWVKTKSVTGAIVFTPPGERTNNAIAEFTDVHVTVKMLKKSESKLKKRFYVFAGTPASVVAIQYSRHGGHD
jgi:hypothetical protein